MCRVSGRNFPHPSPKRTGFQTKVPTPSSKIEQRLHPCVRIIIIIIDSRGTDQNNPADPLGSQQLQIAVLVPQVWPELQKQAASPGVNGVFVLCSLGVKSVRGHYHRKLKPQRPTLRCFHDWSRTGKRSLGEETRGCAPSLLE